MSDRNIPDETVTRRDPRKDPRVGDRIKVKGRIRRVARIDYQDIYYVREGQANAHQRGCYLSTWQNWAAKGDVLPCVAPEPWEDGTPTAVDYDNDCAP